MLSDSGMPVLENESRLQGDYSCNIQELLGERWKTPRESDITDIYLTYENKGRIIWRLRRKQQIQPETKITYHDHKKITLIPNYPPLECKLPLSSHAYFETLRERRNLFCISGNRRELWIDGDYNCYNGTEEIERQGMLHLCFDKIEELDGYWTEFEIELLADFTDMPRLDASIAKANEQILSFIKKDLGISEPFFKGLYTETLIEEGRIKRPVNHIVFRF
ncbi:MAG: hypothetical protein HZB65_04510 [Candidatus Aenigmarchaeota archaeon]|nr:hypothetical protein [Candidatus Aenigmarchaeota archaeon]